MAAYLVTMSRRFYTVLKGALCFPQNCSCPAEGIESDFRMVQTSVADGSLVEFAANCMDFICWGASRISSIMHSRCRIMITSIGIEIVTIL